MSDNILRDIKKIFEIHEDVTYEFKRLHGMTLVFKTKITTLRKRISSAEIKPVGIIYEENDQYYFAPLYGQENINEIVKNYVEDLKRNE